MTLETKSVPKKRRRWLKRIGWTLLIFIAVVLAVRTVASVVTQGALNKRLAVLHTAGEPLHMTEIAPPEIPPERNAATLYLQAFAVMDMLGENVTQRIGVLGGKKEPLSAAEIDEARALLAQSADALKLICEGTLRPECRFSADYDAEFLIGMRLSHLGKVRSAARLLALSSQVNLADDKPDAAAEDCLAMFRLARSVHNEPILISALVELANEQSGRLCLEKVLDRSEPSAETLAKFVPVLADPTNRERFVHAMRGERIFGINMFEIILEHPTHAIQLIQMMTQMTSQAPPPPKAVSGPKVVLASYTPPVVAQAAPAPAVAKPDAFKSTWGMPEQPIGARIVGGGLSWLARPVIVNDFSKYLDFMSGEVALAGKPYLEAHAQWQATDNELMAMSPFAHPMARILLPALRRAAEVYERNIASGECAQTAVALRLYRLKHGAYPDTLDALVPGFLPSVSKDPFTGANLIYRRDGQGFVVYSVGLSGKDHGGVSAPEGRPSDEGDIVWKCSR